MLSKHEEYIFYIHTLRLCRNMTINAKDRELAKNGMHRKNIMDTLQYHAQEFIWLRALLAEGGPC